MKIYIICLFLYKYSIWEKSCSRDIGKNALSHSDCRIFKSIISLEQIDETASFLHVDENSQKLKVNWKAFGGGWSKLSVANLVLTVKLTVSQERTDGTGFLHAGTISHN